MKAQHVFALIAALGAASVSADSPPTEEPLPLVGTDAHGHTYPGATVPFGMVQLSPDTPMQGWDGCSGYHYSQSVILGFSHTHLSGTGAAGLGDILVMPAVGEVKLDHYSSHFSHDKERAVPGYYRVFLDDPKVTAELTATPRCGFHRYTFPKTAAAHIVVDLAHGIGNRPIRESLRVENSNTLSGSRLCNDWGGRREVFFVMQFSQPFDSVMIERDGHRLDNAARDAEGRRLQVVVNYSTADGAPVLAKVGISGVSIEGARKNLAAEIPGWNFEAVRRAASDRWKAIFDAAEVESFDPHIRSTFYANLYLSSIAPVLYNDVDGAYRGLDHQVHRDGHFQNYTTFSIWDIYRAEWPLLTLLHPDRIDDMVQCLLTQYRQLGQHTTPIWPLWDNETWCMIGYHSVAMISEAYLDGFRGFDAESAYQALRDTAEYDRNGIDTYKSLGYVASSPGEQATSRTIEYAYDDWCLARFAESLGHEEDARQFFQRAANYQNLFDRTTRFFRGRKADGKWRYPFVVNAMVGDEYTEADAWQYAFGVQQDVPGLIALYGGDGGFVKKLDMLFTTNSVIHTQIPDISGLIGQYSQGDEQCHHVAYLYDYAGQPYKTQQRVRQVMATLYDDTPAGQCGNADCGQMAAWYVLSALGIYPMNPGSGIFALGSPVVTKAVLHLKGHDFTIEAKNNRAANIYIQSAQLNGEPLSKPYLTRQQIVSGGKLELVMGAAPNYDWGRSPQDRPPATMPADFQYAALPEPASDKPVRLPFPLHIVCGDEQPVGDFVPDPNITDGDMNHSGDSVDTSAPHAAPEGVYQGERYGSDFSYVLPVPRGGPYLVRLHFAEVFDRGAGQRVEDISINGREVLPRLDIFAAAGADKALVKEFPNVSPDADGNIVIHVAASPNSPDQNAKISGIEVLPQ